MSRLPSHESSRVRPLDRKLAAYLAAGGGLSLTASTEAQAEIVFDLTERPFGINEEVDIDLNSDGQVDFQIDHDRVLLPGGGAALGDYDNSGQTAGGDLLLWQQHLGGNTALPNDNGLGTPIGAAHLDLWQSHYAAGGGSVTALDYLQIDKNDISSGQNPLPIDAEATFDPMGTEPNDVVQTAYVTSGNGDPVNFPDCASCGAYPSALTVGTEIGFNSPNFDFQEGDNFAASGNTIRANRLIDEDMTQIDQHPDLGNNSNVVVPFDGPNFVGLNGEVRYLGFQVNLNDAEDEATLLEVINYGWIGIRIDNEADATGAVVGWAYETESEVPILAGDTGTGGAVPAPEPSSLLLAVAGGAAVLGRFFSRRRGDD